MYDRFKHRRWARKKENGLAESDVLNNEESARSNNHAMGILTQNSKDF